MYYQFFTDKDIPDISGEDYKELIHWCFNNSTYFSLIYKEKAKEIKTLEKYKVSSFYTHSWPESPYCSDGGIMCIYFTDMGAEKVLSNYVSGLFEWESVFGGENPEDLAFYRKDKSLLFSSIIHEGECYLYTRPPECVNQIIKKKGWMALDVDDFDTSKLSRHYF